MVLKFVIQIDVVMQDAYKLVVRRPYIYIYILSNFAYWQELQTT
jgi:hypothetical protein